MKKILYIFSIVLGSWLMAGQAYAICPLCTIAVGAGVGLSRYLGIDDIISGLWIGGLTVSMIVWTVDWLNRKHWNFKYQWPVMIIGYYAIIVLPLKYMGLMNHPLNVLWGINKLLLGIIGGSIIFPLAVWWYEAIKKKNNGHAQFPFQKIVWPVGALLIASLLIYYSMKYYYGY